MFAKKYTSCDNLHSQMATTPTPQQDSFLRQAYGITLKNAAVIFAVVYGIGFLVLSIHRARFGVETTEAFKPRVFSAGILFVLLVGVPCIAMARSLSLLGLTMPRTQIVTGKGAAFIGLIRVLDFWLIAAGLRVGSAIIFIPTNFLPTYPGWLFFLIWCVVAALSEILLIDLNQKPSRTVFTKIALFASLVAIIYRYNTHAFFLQVIWFYAVGLVFLWLRSKRIREDAHTYDWERQGFAVLGIITFFAVFIYSHITPAYGGGAPLRVDMTFTRATSFSASKTDVAFLLEQDSQGYYIVHKPDETETHFLPRDAVAEIVFHGGGDVNDESKR
jgi:hypothetical protein